MQGNCLGYHCLGRNYKGEMIRPAITGGPFIQRFIFLMTNVRVQLYFEAKSASDCTGGNYPGGNDRGAQLCGGHLFRAQLSWGQLSWGGAIILGTIIRVAIIQAQFTAGQLSLFKYVRPFGGQEALGGCFSFDFLLFDKGVDRIVNFCHCNG